MSPRRLAALLAVWVAAAGGVLGLAAALDRPVGEGARDEARPVVADELAEAPVEADPDGGAPAADAEELPPLAPVLDAPPPEEIAALPARERVSRLLELAATRAEPRRLVELGIVYQHLGQLDPARQAYRDALLLEPGDLAARVGMAMVEAAQGPEGLERAAGEMRRLAASHPGEQIATFNEGWLAIYRGDAATVERAMRDTLAIDAQSRLGRAARSLLDSLAAASESGGP